MAGEHGKTDSLAVLLDALKTEDLDQRVTEALPWVLAHQTDLNWRKLTDEARLSNLQNRLGFLIEVTVEAAKRVHLMDAVARLEPWLQWQRSRPVPHFLYADLTRSMPQEFAGYGFVTA